MDLSELKKAREEGARVSPFDGIFRSQEQESQINKTLASVLATRDGKQMMEYLKSITLSAVLPETASDGEMRYREGMRRLVQIIDARAKAETK